MVKKISLLFLLIFFFTIPLFSQDECLVNIGNKFEILIAEPFGDTKEIRLMKGRLKTVTELRLRKEGFVITELSGDSNMPHVYIAVTVVRMAFNVELCIRELVEIQRKPSSVLCVVSTWYASYTGTHGNDSEFIVSGLSQLLDKFLNDYYKANPKEEITDHQQN